MTRRATGSFVLDRWEGGEAERWETAQVQPYHGSKTFTGDISGTSRLQAATLIVEGGPMAYVAVERLEVAIDGRSGTFIVTHRATALGETQHLEIQIVPGSGTGGLDGITGSGEILPDHVLVLEYALPD